MPTYKYDLSFHNFYQGDPGRLFEGHLHSRTGYRLMESHRHDLEEGGNFLWLADIQEGQRENLYLDAVHYTATFADEIAEKIGVFVDRREFAPRGRMGFGNVPPGVRGQGRNSADR